MKQTEAEYATELINVYIDMLPLSNATVKYAAKIAIKDVENTIKYIKSDEIVMSVLGENAPDLMYFNKVLIILKDRL